MSEQTFEQRLARRLEQEHANLDDPVIRAQLQIDHWWQAKLDAEAPLDDGYVVGGFRERRTRYGFNKHWRDPDFDTH